VSCPLCAEPELSGIKILHCASWAVEKLVAMLNAAPPFPNGSWITTEATETDVPGHIELSFTQHWPEQ